MALSLALNILAVLWYTVSGAVRALFSCRTRYKTPDLSSDICVVTGAGQVSPPLSPSLPLSLSLSLSLDFILTASVYSISQGLGRQLSLQLAQCGATLVLWDIDGEKTAAVVEEIRANGGAAYAYVVDCSKKEEVYRAAARVRDEVGQVAVLVNNAGIAPEKAFINGELTDSEIERTYAVNILALYWVSQLLLLFLFY